jgi:inosose dehydratase
MDLTRRSWIMGMGALASLAGTSERVLLGAQTNAWRVDPQRFDSLLETLAEIRRIGFAGFETSYRNLQSQAGQPEAARKQIESTGLQFAGVHIFLGRYDEQTLIAPRDLYEQVATLGGALGAQRLVLSGRAAEDADALARKVDALNRAGEFAKQHGLRLAYHNHGAEFGNGGKEIDGLLRQTDPALVRFLIDAGHASRSGSDVAAFLAAHASRIDGLHVRDARDGQAVPLGQGTFPITEIAAALRAKNWQGWVLAEEERLDGSKPGNAAMEPAITALRKAFQS